MHICQGSGGKTPPRPPKSGGARSKPECPWPFAGWPPIPSCQPSPIPCTERDHAPNFLLFRVQIARCLVGPERRRLDRLHVARAGARHPPLPVPKPGPRILDQAPTAPRGRACLAGVLHRPLLQRLIETALENNRDLRLAALRAWPRPAPHWHQRSDRTASVGVGASMDAHKPATAWNPGCRHRGSWWAADIRPRWVGSPGAGPVGPDPSLEDAALQTGQFLPPARQAVHWHLALIAKVADGYLGLRDRRTRGYRPSQP